MTQFQHIFRLALGTLLILALVSPVAVAQESASHKVNIGISAISVMSVSSDPQPLFLETSSRETNPVVSSASSFYNLTTNIENVFIQAELDLPLPEGVELWLSGESVLGESHGRVQLDGTGAQMVVSRIRRGLENGRELTYELIVAPSVKDIPFQSRTITLTLVDRVNSQQQQLSQTLYFSATTASADDKN